MKPKCPQCKSTDLRLVLRNVVGLKGKKSKYSSVDCIDCNYYWRTKATYIEELE